MFDLLAFLVGGQLFWWSMRRQGARRYTADEKWALAAGCVTGAALGAKLIVLLEEPALAAARATDPAFLASGKSIVGGLLGGLVGVEAAKKLSGIEGSTGDHFALPIAVGLAVGRIGCFLSGLEDDTFGVATSLPWGVDMGDGVARHPAALYEVLFGVAMAVAVVRLRGRLEREGDLFRLLMVAYLAFRFAEEFVRVSPRAYAGFTVYQLACLAGLAYYLRDADTRARLLRLATGRRQAERGAAGA